MKTKDSNGIILEDVDTIIKYMHLSNNSQEFGVPFGKNVMK